jgi:hypothetical protein
MRLVAGLTFALLLVRSPGAAQQLAPAENQRTAPADAEALPVERVVLYKNGIGFFEHLGRVRGTQQVTIDFTSGQLDDVLKSLTTVDLGNGKVTGISFNTDDPASRKLGTLSLPLGEETSVLAFLGALRGARVEVQSGAGPVVGRVLSVESRVRTEGERTVESRELAIVSDAGELRTVEVTPRLSVRVLEGEVRGEIRRYLDVLSSTRQRDLRRMTIATSGTGERQLYVSYISEVPIWKSTYRLVLPSKPGDKPLLQGWAIVDNTIGEDWTDVELSLVAGSPQSFVQQLSQPFYARRPVIPLPSAVQLSPQTHDATLAPAGASAETPADAPSAMRAEPRGRVAGGMPGGVVGGMVGGVPEAPPPPPPPAPAREAAVRVAGNLEAAAQGRELGDLFEYRLKEPVTIRKNQSALVPIVAASVEAERVSVWSAATGQRPRAAVWITNSTSNTLDGGSVSVLEDATFTGEGLVDPVKPGERRLLSYAADLALLVDWKPDSPEPERVTSVRVARGLLIVQREYRDRRVYTVRNEDAKARTLVIEHPNRAGWKLTGTVKPDETAPSVYRFRLPVAPKATASLTVEEVRPAETTVQLANVSDDQVALLVRQKSVTPEIEQALRAVLSKKGEIATVSDEIRVREEERKRIFDDQERLRENMKALGTRTEEKSLVARYTRQLEDQETRLDTLKAELAAREVRREKLQQELDAMVQGLGFGK